MSGSPKYTSVAVSRERRQREAAARARRAAQRRQRQADREARLRALAEQRAQQRLAREAEQRSKFLEQSRRAASGHVAAVGAAVADVRRDVTAAGAAAVADQVRAIQADLASLESRVGAGGTSRELSEYEREAEALRARALALRSQAFRVEGRAGRQHVLADLQSRFATLQASRTSLDPAQLSRCGEVLAELEAAAPLEGVRFEALHGTAEHAVASLERRAADARAREDQASAADQAHVARQAATALDLEDVAARLAVLTESAQTTISDAAAFGEHALGDQLHDVIAAAEAALSAGQLERATAEIARLEALLPGAEAQLDEAQAAYERRGDLAVALQDLLTSRGMAFTGGSDQDGRFTLHFERPGGAVYTAMIDSDAAGDLTLSYAIDGEPDVAVLAPASGEAVCDRTEAFLDAVHEELATAGFEAGELQWNGKPPRGRARTLPRQQAGYGPADAGRRRQHE
jgi:hypothetical protein